MSIFEMVSSFPFVFKCDEQTLYCEERLFVAYSESEHGCSVFKHGNKVDVEQTMIQNNLLKKMFPSEFKKTHFHMIEVKSDDLVSINHVLNTSLIPKKYFDELERETINL